MIAKNLDDRLAIIKAIAEKQKNEKARKERLATIRKNTAKVRIVARKKRTAEDKKLTDFTGGQDNVNHYTDASKYAEEYYGDRMRQTTCYDNDWD